MARYKAIDTSPRFLAVDLERQLLPGSFEHAVHHRRVDDDDLHACAQSRRAGRGVAAGCGARFTVAWFGNTLW